MRSRIFQKSVQIKCDLGEARISAINRLITMQQIKTGPSSTGADVALNQLRPSTSQPSHHSVQGRDVEFQHSVGDPLGLSVHLKEESEIKANISRRRQGANRAADGLK